MTWDKSRITTLLLTNDKALHKAIIKIYERQTADEQAYGATLVYNNIGFNGVDAQIMSSFARQLMEKGFLSPKQKAIALKKMPKYWAQIKQLIEEKEAKQ